MTTNSENQNLIERLFTAGAHFGFSKSRRHPTMKPFLFGNKQGTDIFDLEKTAVLLEEAKVALKEAGSNGKKVVFVGTKDEVSIAVKACAEKVEAPYVVNRWIGGMLTNFSEIKKRINRLIQLTEEGESGELERKYTKKERVVIGREAEKLSFNFGGIKTLDRTPDMMLVVDPRHDHIAVTEAKEKGIPVVAIMSSDNNVSVAKYPVIVNDTLQASVNLALDELTAAYAEGAATYVPKAPARPSTNRRHRENAA